MRAEFRPYQVFAIKHLIEQPVAGLFLDLGLGKTLITLTAIGELLRAGWAQRILVVAPKTVAETVWDAEIRKWDHLNGLIIAKVLGSEKERRKALMRPAHIYITNVDNVRWLLTEFGLDRWPFDTVVIDELSKFKSHQAKRFKDLQMFRPQIARVVGLTATPTPNSMVELWPEMALLDGGYRLGDTITGFRERFFTLEAYTGKYVAKEGAREAIYRLIGDICISMSQEDYLQLPDLIEIEKEAILSPEEIKAYKVFERTKVLEMAQSGERVTAVNAGVLVNKLLQYAGGSIYDRDGNTHFIHERKLDVLEDLIEGMNGNPVLVAYWYDHERAAIVQRLGAKNVVVFNEFKDKQKIIDAWNAGSIPIMLVQAQGAAHGLNLQFGGSHIIWFSAIWSSEIIQQFNGRLHRSGQVNNVIVYKILCRGTIDYEVNQAVKAKISGQDALLAAVKAKFTEYAPDIHRAIPAF